MSFIFYCKMRYALYIPLKGQNLWAETVVFSTTLLCISLSGIPSQDLQPTASAVLNFTPMATYLWPNVAFHFVCLQLEVFEGVESEQGMYILCDLSPISFLVLWTCSLLCTKVLWIVLEHGSVSPLLNNDKCKLPHSNISYTCDVDDSYIEWLWWSCGWTCLW